MEASFIIVARRSSGSHPHARRSPGSPFAEEPGTQIRRSWPEPPPTVREVRVGRSVFARVPVVIVGAAELRDARLDGRAGFLLSLVDGSTSIEHLLDVSGMTSDEVLAVLEELRLRGIVRF
jgi:hypothetical protein